MLSKIILIYICSSTMKILLTDLPLNYQKVN